MNGMIRSAEAFNADIGRWNVSVVTDMMSCMFYDARAFNADISRWDISKVTDMMGILGRVESFSTFKQAY